MDIEWKAVEFMQRHGDQAPVFAAMEADAALEAGDLDGAAHWRLSCHCLVGGDGAPALPPRTAR